MIFSTPYDPATLHCTGPSTDSGFSTLDEVPMLLGEPDMRHPRMLTYAAAGVAYSDFVLHIDTGVSDVAGFVQSPTGST